MNELTHTEKRYADQQLMSMGLRPIYVEQMRPLCRDEYQHVRGGVREVQHMASLGMQPVVQDGWLLWRRFKDAN